MNWRMAWKLESHLAWSTELVSTNGKRDPASTPGGRKELISEQLFSKLHTCIMCDHMYTHTPCLTVLVQTQEAGQMGKCAATHAFAETERL